MSKYGWIIDNDMTGEGKAGTVGPADISPEIEAQLKTGAGDTFKLYDGDGELYYCGRIVRTHKGFRNEDDDIEEGFEPLDDFGVGAGCTTISVNGIFI